MREFVGRSVAVGGPPLRGVSTPGHGQGEGPVGSKLSRSDDADDDGRGRSDAKRNGVLEEAGCRRSGDRNKTIARGELYCRAAKGWRRPS